MNEQDIAATWTTINPTTRQRRRIDAQVFAWVDARDTSLAAEWLGLFKVAPLQTFALVAVSAVSVVMATPILWFARALISR